MKVKPIGAIVLALMISLFFAAPVYADGEPVEPHPFYGTLTINGMPAPPGVEVEAGGEGVLTGVPYNPLTTTEAGHYGGPDGLDPALVIQGNITNGTNITFYINGFDTGQTYPFQIPPGQQDAEIEGRTILFTGPCRLLQDHRRR